MLTRPVVMLLTILALGCGGGTEPPGDTGIAGLWDATITTHGHLLQGLVVTCSVSWAMKIEDIGTPGAPEPFTTVPFTPVISCDNGDQSPWEHRGRGFYVHQDGASVVFLTVARLDTFLVATVSGSTMDGRIGTGFYNDGSLRATRRSGPDPNLEPTTFAVGANYPDMEIAETLRAGSHTENGYGLTLDTLTVAWTSRSPAYATIDPDGLIHGVSPGTAWIVGQVAGLRDSFSMTVLGPAASVEITSGPDSIIVPQGGQLVAIAKDAGGQPLLNRRLTFESSSSAVATIDGSGFIAALEPGTVTLTARSTIVSASRSIRVLPAVATVTLNAASTAVTIGGTRQVTATTRDAQGNVLTGRPVHWEENRDGRLVTIDQNGLVTGVTAGPVTVSAQAEDSIGTLEITVQMDGPLTAIAAGDRHSCALATTGHVYCWGWNDAGQLGPTAIGFTAAALVPSPEHFAAIAANDSHTCALNTAGAAFCWGLPGLGQLGGTPSAQGELVAVTGGLTFTRLVAGYGFNCGLSSGSAFCWGQNGAGQLGRGSSDFLDHTAPAAVVGGHTFTTIATSFYTTCGLTAGGQAWCWGGNEFGQLGLGTQDTLPHPTPVHAAPALTFTAIAPGFDRTCGITTGSGVVQCWGGSTGLDPAPLDATTGYVEIAAGGSNFCRVDGAGIVSCFGVPGLDHLPGQAVTGVKLGLQHACARVVATGRMVCWGDNFFFQLGDGTSAGAGPAEPLGQP
ncbi:MAG: Ig-like domain-containing protein [Gemmatimonadales bacterium]